MLGFSEMGFIAAVRAGQVRLNHFGPGIIVLVFLSG
jgi:hypothetical protein